MELQATYDDVNLVLHLYELRREEKLRKAREWFGQSFKARTLEEMNALCPMGSENNAYLRMVISYWEMAASFITGGVLNQELFFQSGGELLFVWERIRDVVPHMREMFASKHYLQNLETVAASYGEWMNRRSPGAYAAFSERARAM
jgi:hypothetical protein